MKSKLRSSRPLKFLAALSAITLFSASGLFANYGAFVSSTGAGSFGAFGLSWNWRSSNSAINAAVSSARYYNGGYLNGYRYNWWGQRGWEAGVRGYNYDGSYVNFGYARGWSTRNSAINYANGFLGYNTYWYGRMSGYNY